MRKSATSIAALFALASCMLESENPVAPVFEDSCIKTDITVSREDGFSGSKAAVKSDWVEGDVVFVFFQKAPAPKYLELKYSSGAWTSTGKNGLALSELGSSGKMTAIHLPYGSDAVVGADGSNFVFQGQKYNGVFLQAEQSDYSVTGDVLKGGLKMAAPALAADTEKYIHLDVTGYSEGHDYTLYQDYIRPLTLFGVSADGVVRKYSSTVLQPVQGHIDAELGIVSFSGILDLRALNQKKDYSFNIDDSTSQTLYTRTVASKTLGDSKYIGVGNLSDTEKWSAVEYVDLGFSANPGERLLWAVKNDGATDSFDPGALEYFSGFEYVVEVCSYEEALYMEEYLRYLQYLIEGYISKIDDNIGLWRLPTRWEYSLLLENSTLSSEGNSLRFTGRGNYSESCLIFPEGRYAFVTDYLYNDQAAIDEMLYAIEEYIYRCENGDTPEDIYGYVRCPIWSFDFRPDIQGWSENFEGGYVELSFRRVFSLGAFTSPVAEVVPEMVDLGLSVKWASCNLGASSPEEYGNYYAWGETEPKTDYSWWATYKWCGRNQLTKYCNKSSYGYNGFTDSKTVLDPDDDAATVALGDSWRMPTKAEQDELVNNCTWTKATLNGVYGIKITSNKAGYTDKWIFLPAAGYRSGTSLQQDANIINGLYGCYWSSSLYTGNPEQAYNMYLYSNSGSVGTSSDVRYLGRSIRPVYTK